MGDIALWDAVSIVVGEKVCFFQGFRGDFMCDHKTTMCCRLSIFLSMLKRYVSESVIDSSTPQKRRPPGIRLGIPALQHLHLWPANHRLQKVCICWRPSSHTCWWRLAGSGRGGEQAHGNRWWIRPDLEVKAQHYRVSAVFHLNNKEAKRELKVNLNNKTLPFCSEPKYCSSEKRSTGRSRITDTSSHFAKSWHHASHSWGGLLGCWSNNIANSHPCPGPFNSGVLRSHLVPQCSHPPHWPRYQRRLGNYDWLPASYTSGQPSCSRWHPTCGASSQWSHTVSSTPCHGAWTSAPLSAHLSTECECTAPQIGTPVCTYLS